MLVLDTPAQERWRQGVIVERTRQLTRDAFAQKLAGNEIAIRPDNGVSVTNQEAQLGKVLSTGDFVERVRRCNDTLVYQQSKNFPDRGGFYQWIPDPTEPSKQILKMVGAVTHGWIPEFTVRLVKKEQVPDVVSAGNLVTTVTPTGLVKGWRTCLAALYRQRLVTRSAIEQHFPHLNRDSMYWSHVMNH